MSNISHPETTESPQLPGQPGAAQPAVAPRLAELEAVIGRGLATFVEVGQALLEIRDAHLYRETHPTFEAYCQERWGWNRSNAQNYITAASVSLNVQPVEQLPSLRHAMLLSSFSPDEQRTLAPVVSAMSVSQAREFIRGNGAHVMHNAEESSMMARGSILNPHSRQQNTP